MKDAVFNGLYLTYYYTKRDGKVHRTRSHRTAWDKIEAITWLEKDGIIHRDKNLLVIFVKTGHNWYNPVQKKMPKKGYWLVYSKKPTTDKDVVVSAICLGKL